MSDDAVGFVSWFRACAPYIHAHRGRTFVVVVGGECLKGPGIRELVHDVALLHSLGVRVVLVVGARPQIDARLAARGAEPRYHRGLRITDDLALSCVKEAVGATRVELEALLSMGLPDSPMAHARIRVATGNYVTARPVGIIDGVDYQHTGAIRRIDAEAIRQRLDAGAVVILTAIGYSATGEAFNVSTPEVAEKTAIALGADKLVCLVEGKGVVDGRGGTVTELNPAAAREVLGKKRRFAAGVRLCLEAAVGAVDKGVPRAHLVPRKLDGGLLVELFTREGAGTLVSALAYEGVRRAQIGDVGGLLTLIEPLAEAGVLVRRPREMLEMDIERFTVVERDGMIVACAAVYPYPEERIAEVACVAVHPDYQSDGRGDMLLEYLERQAREQGIGRLFVLTTQTAHWFRERGFSPRKVGDLPAARRPAYDRRRRSKVFIKELAP